MFSLSLCPIIKLAKGKSKQKRLAILNMNVKEYILETKRT